MMISQEYLKKYIDYCPLSGSFKYKERDESDFTKKGFLKHWNNKYAGKDAITFQTNGSAQITIRDKRYLATKLAFLYQTGEYPTDEIHHLDSDKTNNRFSNLKIIKRSNLPLTQERLKELFSYDKNTGIFTRLSPMSSTSKKGDKAGTKFNTGYIVIGIDGKRFSAHRLAWLYTYGEFPKKQIDHINQMKDDNRIANLREASCSENAQNRTKSKTNKNYHSDLLGACYDASKNNKQWFAQLILNGKKVFLKYFDTPEEAHEAYLREKRKLHEFCNF